MSTLFNDAPAAPAPAPALPRDAKSEIKEEKKAVLRPITITTTNNNAAPAPTVVRPVATLETELDDFKAKVIAGWDAYWNSWFDRDFRGVNNDGEFLITQRVKDHLRGLSSIRIGGGSYTKQSSDHSGVSFHRKLTNKELGQVWDGRTYKTDFIVHL